MVGRFMCAYLQLNSRHPYLTSCIPDHVSGIFVFIQNWWSSSPERSLRRAYRDHQLTEIIFIMVVSIRARLALTLLDHRSILKRKTMTPTIRLSLPSKGRLESDALDFLSAAGLRVFKPNPRQYEAEVPAIPELGIIFQRPGDIVVSVRQGS